MNHTNMHMHTLPVYALNFEILKFSAVLKHAWKNRKLKTETDTETDGGNGNTQAIIT